MPQDVPSVRDTVIIGGGISGLTTAFHLARAGRAVTLLEGSEQVGGAITSHHDDGWRFELGPSTVLENNPRVGELIRSAGLEAEKIVARPAARKRYVWKGGRLVPLPSGPVSFARTKLFSRYAKLRLLREPLTAPSRESVEETVAQFVRRRLGTEMLDYAVGPFVSGVYAGDPERLSMRWAVAKLHALEQQHGSLIKGAFARRKGPAPGGSMFTFTEGLQSLPEAMAAVIGDVRTSTAARGVRRARDGSFVVDTYGESLRARRVVVAVPADVMARLLEQPSQGRSAELAEMPYAPIVTTALGFRRSDVSHPLDGFGFLAPRKESLRILGCLFPSSIFPGRAPDGHVALMAFAGGRTDPAAVELEDDDVFSFVQGELERALGVRAPPVYRLLRRWPRAIPQYELGHARFVGRRDDIERANPGLHLGSNAFGGISVPDCIRKGAELADRLLSTEAVSLGNPPRG